MKKNSKKIGNAYDILKDGTFKYKLTSSLKKYSPAWISKAKQSWIRVWDPKTGKYYYANTMSGISQWWKPSNYDRYTAAPKAARERAARERAAREQAARERAAREIRRAREKKARERAAREKEIRERKERERKERERKVREKRQAEEDAKWILHEIKKQTREKKAKEKRKSRARSRASRPRGRRSKSRARSRASRGRSPKSRVRKSRVRKSRVRKSRVRKSRVRKSRVRSRSRSRKARGRSPKSRSRRFRMNYKQALEILKVNKNSTKATIKKAYHKLALKNHPDKGGNTETFKKIANAYDIVKKGPEFMDKHIDIKMTPAQSAADYAKWRRKVRARTKRNFEKFYKERKKLSRTKTPRAGGSGPIYAKWQTLKRSPREKEDVRVIGEMHD